MTDPMIDGATLAAAERLFGIQYTDTERAQMLDNLADQVELAVRRRCCEAAQLAAASNCVRSTSAWFHYASAVPDEHRKCRTSATGQ